MINIIVNKVEYLETHFEVVSAIVRQLDNEKSTSYHIRETQGLGGLYELAEELTDEFQEKYENYEFDGDFLDLIDLFLKDRV